jgi:hypothetical protein
VGRLLPNAEDATLTIDAAADLLHQLGWSTGTHRTLDALDGPLCVVEGSQGEHVIRTRSDHPPDAWTEAAHLATSITLGEP